MGIETLAYGYGLIEGPRWAPDGSLYFSDVPNGGVHRLRPDGTVEVVVPKRRGVGGIALHADGGLVLSGRNVCHVRDGETRILYARDDVGGFNDLFADARGRVIVGSLRDDPFGAMNDRRTGDCYRVDAPGEAVTLYEGVALTNGIGFSPDGRTLYHADTPVGVIAHDVDDDGGVVPGSRRVFATVDRGAVDGLTVDRDGGVWVAAVDGYAVARFTPQGALDRRIPMPAKRVTSLVFGGVDLDELYVVSADNTDDPSRQGSVFRVSADLVGAVGMPAPLVRI
jgi:gluconolactonase